MTLEFLVNLDFDESQSLILAEASSPAIWLNPAIKIFLSRVKAVKYESRIEIKADLNSLGNIYKQLISKLNEIGCNVQETSVAQEIFEDVKKKEVEFYEHTQKAYDIWSRKAEPKELKAFEEIISSHIKRELTKLQFLSALHLAISQNACNFSVPGAGKTTIVYSAYAYLKSLEDTDSKHIDRILVIGPLASFIAWQKEYENCFGYPAKSARIMAGMTFRERHGILKGINPYYRDIELIHTSFQTACNYEDEIAEFLAHPTLKTMLVIDEAHNIKREDGVWAQACIRLADNANARVILTGTPAPNGYEDLYNLFKFLYPQKNIIGFPRPNLISMTENRMSSEPMRERIRPFFTRITKKNLDLPDIHQELIKLEMSPSEKRIYQLIEDSIIPTLQKDEELIIEPFQRANMIRLRQAVSNAQMLLMPLEEFSLNLDADSGISIKNTEAYELIKNFKFVESAKYLELKRLCKEKLEVGQKILIWSYFISTLDNIEENLAKDLDIKVMRISGETPSEGNGEVSDVEQLTREQIIRAFIDDDDAKILVANPQALGESVSLHYSCHTAIYFDRDFNCGRFIQSKDRIHRYGLPKNVITNYYYFSYNDTIDIDIATRLDIKETRMNNLIERDEIPLFREMDDGAGEEDDIKAVLKSYAARKLR